MNRRRVLGAGLAALLAPAAARAQMPAYTWDDGSVPFVVTPMEVVATLRALGGAESRVESQPVVDEGVVFQLPRLAAADPRE